MWRKFRLLVLIAVTGCSSIASGQINYSKESAIYLAELFASEKGGDPDDYLTYSWRLAESLSFLSVEEQMYVFGIENPALLSGLPSGTPLPRPVRLVWGQKIGEGVADVPVTATIPAPTVVQIYDDEGTPVNSPIDLTPVSAASAIGPKSVTVSSVPSMAIELSVPKILTTIISGNTPATIAVVKSSDDPAISQLEYAVGDGAWSEYADPLIVVPEIYPGGVEIKARTSAAAGFESAYLTSQEVSVWVDAPLSVNAQISLNPINFKMDSAELESDAFAELVKVQTFLRTYPKLSITIGGHTDSDPSQKFASNQVLSEYRAEVVKAFLVSGGIEADRIATIGYGDSQPLVPNTTAANKAENRRIEFLF